MMFQQQQGNCWSSYCCWRDDYELVDYRTNNPDTAKPFGLPASLPSWPPGSGFAEGVIGLGELEVAQVSTFQKVWSSYGGGNNNHGASFYKPINIPDGFFCLGHYCQTNSSALDGWVLVAREINCTSPCKDEVMEAPQIPPLALQGQDAKPPALAKPLNYTLVWGSDSWGGGRDELCYIWLPYPPEGYKALGFVTTSRLNKPSLDEVKCVREDLTEPCECNEAIWSTSQSSSSKFPFAVWTTRPCDRGIQSKGVCVGTYYCNNALYAEDNFPISCLRNVKFNLTAMPTLSQVHSLIRHYGPTVYFHPDEIYLPSSVNWFFEKGALLCAKEEERGIPIDQNGINLPGGGSNDGQFWIDLPDDDGTAEQIKKGNMDSAEVYVHVKPMYGATFTDIAMWVFCPFNGPVTVKIGMLSIALSKIGEHVSDWEHFTLRISNFNGKLWKIYFSQHSGGEWVCAPDLEYIEGNKAIVYSSKHGHASFPHAGDFLQGDSKLGVGIRNDTAKSSIFLDTSKRYHIVSAEYMAVFNNNALQEPAWLQYMREWGPTIIYDSCIEFFRLLRFLPSRLKHAVENIYNKLPTEIGSEEGPTGPKEKDNWIGDERGYG